MIDTRTQADIVEGVPVGNTDADKLYADVLTRFEGRHIELIYLSQGDSLTLDQVEQLLSDDDYPDSLSEWESDCRWDGASFYINDEVTEEEQEILGDELLDELRYHLYDMDESNIVRDLGRNTLCEFRYRVDDIDQDGSDTQVGWDSSWIETAREAIKIRKLLGIPSDKTQQIIDLLNNVGNGGDWYVGFKGYAWNFIQARWEGHDTITITNPELICFNRWEGSGFSDPIDCTITLPYKHENLVLDHGNWSWNDVVGGWCPSGTAKTSKESNE